METSYKSTESTYTKQTKFYFNILLLAFLCFGCQNTSDSTSDKRSDKTFKLRIELTNENNNREKIGIHKPAYTFLDKNGEKQGHRFGSANNDEFVDLPFKEEYKIPENFFVLSFEAGSPMDIIDTNESNLNAKVYINNKLILSESCRYLFAFSIKYELETKKYLLEYISKPSDILDLNRKTIEKLF